MWIPILFSAGLMGLVLLAVVVWIALKLGLQKRLQCWSWSETASRKSITRLVWLAAVIFPVVVYLGFWVFASLELKLWQVISFLFPL
ncbi:hypothetical protein J4G07_12690 [Candidatus Poribacteria bacterium]|nr:hypothetical protein [Candidatus Poribacteria bacterium]